MSNRLKHIFEAKREEVHLRKTVAPAQRIEAMAIDAPSARGFYNALIKSPLRPALIAEIKRASPSQGPIRPDLDPVALAQIYVNEGAACLSVLTDQTFFGGTIDDLLAVRAVLDAPILRKDFIFDPYQVYESKAMGADCILLIVAGLPFADLLDLHALATDIGLDVLVETHDVHEAQLAVDAGFPLIGVNNRDLTTFETDLTTTRAVASVVGNAALLVSESALKSRQDVEQVVEWGAEAVLIGTAFCEADDEAVRVREIMPWQ